MAAATVRSAVPVPRPRAMASATAPGRASIARRAWPRFRRPPRGRPLGETRGARPHTGDLQNPPAIVRPLAAGDGGQPEMAREAARLEVDGGEDEDLLHAPRAESESASAAGRSPFRRTHASYDFPAAVSFPVNLIVAIFA